MDASYDTAAQFGGGSQRFFVDQQMRHAFLCVLLLSMKLTNCVRAHSTLQARVN